MFAREILEISYKSEDNSCLSKEQLVHNLEKVGITNYKESDLQNLINVLSCSDNGQMKAVLRYANGHLFPLYRERSDLLEQIARKTGNLTTEDFENIDLYEERVRKLTDYAQ